MFQIKFIRKLVIKTFNELKEICNKDTKTDNIKQAEQSKKSKLGNQL